MKQTIISKNKITKRDSVRVTKNNVKLFKTEIAQYLDSNGFLSWSAKGDGFSIIPERLDNETDALLIMRNMLPAADFENTVQNTSTPGDEEAVMGEFFPTVQYFTKDEFESLGCDAYTAMPQ